MEIKMKINEIKNNNFYSNKQQKSFKSTNNLHSGVQIIKEHPFDVIKNLGTMFAIAGVGEYLDNYANKNLPTLPKRETKEVSLNALIENIYEKYREVKKNKPAKFYSLLLIGMVITSFAIFGNKQTFLINDENKEKNLKKSKAINTFVGTAVSSTLGGTISSSFLNEVDFKANIKNSKTKNTLKGIVCGLIIGSTFATLSLLANKLTLDKFKKEQAQESLDK